jgi:hypothetical protein
VFEIIAALDPLHRRNEWADLRTRYGERITSTVIYDASHALFPEQPDASPRRSSATTGSPSHRSIGTRM